jgi:hypothetical protein
LYRARRAGRIEQGTSGGSKNPAVKAALAQQSDLERQNRQLRRKLAHAERIIAIKKKAATLLGETLQGMSLDEID